MGIQEDAGGAVSALNGRSGTTPETPVSLHSGVSRVRCISGG